jgi:hypothetical protein
MAEVLNYNLQSLRAANGERKGCEYESAIERNEAESRMSEKSV